MLGLTQHLCRISTCRTAGEVRSQALTASSPSFGQHSLELCQREDYAVQSTAVRAVPACTVCVVYLKGRAHMYSVCR